MKRSMQKILLTLILAFSCCISVWNAYAADAPDLLKEASSSKAPIKPVDKNLAPQFTDQQIDELLKEGEVGLRKIKAAHVREERIEHALVTEEKYQKALALYRQNRPNKAREVFVSVQDSIVAYKSTDSYVKLIDNRNIQKLRAAMRRVRKLEENSLVISLSQKATSLYHQADNLGDSPEVAELRNNLEKLVTLMKNLKQEKE